jgi:replicative DNA helicase
MYYDRAIAWASNIDALDIICGFDGERQPEKRDTLLAVGEALVNTLPLSIEEGEITADRVEADLRRHANEHGIAMVAIDFWQDIDGGEADNRREKFVKLARRMKHLSQNELKVPFLIASQVTYNQGTGTYDAMESRQIEIAATLQVMIAKEKLKPSVAKTKEPQLSLVCEKNRVFPQFVETPIRVDKAHSRIHLLDNHQGDRA